MCLYTYPNIGKVNAELYLKWCNTALHSIQWCIYNTALHSTKLTSSFEYTWATWAWKVLFLSVKGLPWRIDGSSAISSSKKSKNAWLAWTEEHLTWMYKTHLQPAVLVQFQMIWNNTHISVRITRTSHTMHLLICCQSWALTSQPFLFPKLYRISCSHLHVTA